MNAQTVRVDDAIADGILSPSAAGAKGTALREGKSRLERAKRSPYAGVDRPGLRSRILKAARDGPRQETTLWETATPTQRKRIVRAHVKGIQVNDAESTIRVECSTLTCGIHDIPSS